MACEYALCSLFVPGDRQIILGTKVCGFSVASSQESFSYFLKFDINIQRLSVELSHKSLEV